MILVDFSSIIHRMIHRSVATAKPQKTDGKYNTPEFINLTKYFILQDLFEVKKQHESRFGDMIICLDNSQNGYWRKDVYSGYKGSRKSGRDESEINYQEVFTEINELIEQMSINLPWKVISVPRAEADDTMLVLSEEFNKYEQILILSPDKDIIQAQRGTDNVFQYSALTRKWLTADTKSDDMEGWVQEHCILGDAGDDVPKVVDHTEFTPVFIEFLKEQNLHGIETPMDFKSSDYSNESKIRCIEEFDVFKLNRKKESTGIKDIYNTIRFGPTTLKKKIKEFGTVDAWLDSHPMYRDHFERNFTLVMMEGIPKYIWDEILVQFSAASTTYNDRAFEDYLKNNNLKAIIMELPNIFKISRDLSADDFGW